MKYIYKKINKLHSVSFEKLFNEVASVHIKVSKRIKNKISSKIHFPKRFSQKCSKTEERAFEKLKQNAINSIKSEYPVHRTLFSEQKCQVKSEAKTGKTL